MGKRGKDAPLAKLLEGSSAIGLCTPLPAGPVPPRPRALGAIGGGGGGQAVQYGAWGHPEKRRSLRVVLRDTLTQLRLSAAVLCWGFPDPEMERRYRRYSEQQCGRYDATIFMAAAAFMGLVALSRADHYSTAPLHAAAGASHGASGGTACGEGPPGASGAAPAAAVYGRLAAIPGLLCMLSCVAALVVMHAWPRGYHATREAWKLLVMITGEPLAPCTPLLGPSLQFLVPPSKCSNARHSPHWLTCTVTAKFVYVAHSRISQIQVQIYPWYPRFPGLVVAERAAPWR